MLQIYKNIKKRRKELNMTQDELAKLTGYTNKSSIATIESGKIDLPQSKIIEFANALQISPSDLMGWEDFDYEEDSHTWQPTQDIHYRNQRMDALMEISENLSDEDFNRFITIAKALFDKKG